MSAIAVRPARSKARWSQNDSVCQVVRVFDDGHEEVKVPIILESDARIYARTYNRMGKRLGWRVKVHRIATLASILSDPRRQR